MPSAQVGDGAGPDRSLPFVSIACDGFCYGPLVDRLPADELAGSASAQRWSDAGAPTIYLASDVGVALAEWGRHVPVDDEREPSGLWRVRARLRRAVDLRRADGRAVEGLTRAAGLSRFGGQDDPSWWLDQERTRDLAAWLRYVVGVDGLIVPSVAFLDDRSRGNLVLFIEDDRPASRMIAEPARIAEVRWTDDGPAVARIDTEVQLAAGPALRLL